MSDHAANQPEARLPFLLSVAGAVLLLQFILAAISFPLPELSSQKPLFHIDAAWHWYHIKVAKDLFETGNLVGYDPTFNAGYPGGVTYNWSAKIPALWAILLKTRCSEVVVYKLYAFVSAVIGPVFVPIGFFLLRMRRSEMAFGSLCGVILWWVSVFHWYHTAGMVAFVVGSYGSFAYFAWVLRYLDGSGGVWALVGMGLTGALAMFWHPLFPLPIVLGTLLFLAMNRQGADRTRVLKLLTIVPLLAVLPNLVWLYPMFHYQKVFVAGVSDISPYGKIVAVGNLWRELAGIWSGNAHGSKLYAPLALATVWGWFSRGRLFPDRCGRITAVLGIALSVLAHLGGGIPLLRFIQPNRFAPVGYLFLCVPASLGVSAMWRRARDVPTGWLLRRAAQASLVILGLITAYTLKEVREEVSWTHSGHYGAPPPEARDLGGLSLWVLNWLEHDTTADGRVLFETSKARIHDGAHMAGYYAASSGRSFIGGPYPFTNFAGFWDGTVFGKQMSQIPQETFAQYLDLYNIGWILAHSAEAKHYLDHMPGVVSVAAYEELKAYRCERPLSYFLQGNGHVADQGTNRLALSGLDGGNVVIKFHYIPGIKSDPPATLLPVPEMDDPNPFIKIVNPPRQIRLFM